MKTKWWWKNTTIINPVFVFVWNVFSYCSAKQDIASPQQTGKTYD